MYAEFLENELPPLFENVPLNIRQRLIFQQDGAPAHNSRVARRVLNEMFPNSWIGTHSPLAQWPARSPDLTVCDFFLWGFIKEKVYKTPVHTREELLNRLREAFALITPEMLRKLVPNIVRRAEICVEHEGRHIEQYLK